MFRRSFVVLALVGFVACDTAAPEDELAVVTGAHKKGGCGHKVEVCHRAGGHGKVVAISVSQAAVAAHLAHGDTLAYPDGTCGAGPCDALPEGAMYCDGTGFITCTEGAPVYRDCAPGTACVDTASGILCDWPAVSEE